MTRTSYSCDPRSAIPAFPNLKAASLPGDVAGGNLETLTQLTELELGQDSAELACKATQPAVVLRLATLLAPTLRNLKLSYSPPPGWFAAVNLLTGLESLTLKGYELSNPGDRYIMHFHGMTGAWQPLRYSSLSKRCRAK